jgi:hypothetical protein
MAAVFMRALVRLVEASPHNKTAETVLPTGKATVRSRSCCATSTSPTEKEEPDG